MNGCYRSLATRQYGWLCHLLALCFVVRALIPPGYMPDMAAASKQPLKLVICTAQGLKTIAAPGRGAAPNGDRDSHDGADCAFATLSAVAQMPLISGAVQPLQIAIPRTLPFAMIGPREPVRRSGPSFGSRAPPRAA